MFQSFKTMGDTFKNQDSKEVKGSLDTSIIILVPQKIFRVNSVYFFKSCCYCILKQLDIWHSCWQKSKSGILIFFFNSWAYYVESQCMAERDTAGAEFEERNVLHMGINNPGSVLDITLNFV